MFLYLLEKRVLIIITHALDFLSTIYIFDFAFVIFLHMSEELV